MSSTKIFPLKLGTDKQETNSNTEKENRDFKYLFKCVELVALYINPLIYVIFIIVYFSWFMSFFVTKYSY